MYIHQDCLILQEDLTSLGQLEADWQMTFNVCQMSLNESDSALASQTNSLQLFTTQSNFGTCSVGKIPWYHHY